MTDMRSSWIVLVIIFGFVEVHTFTLNSNDKETQSSTQIEVDYYPHSRFNKDIFKNLENYNDIQHLNSIQEELNRIKQQLPEIEFSTSASDKRDVETSALDSWSVVWYIASFGGLIAFFMVVSCSEWCCRKHPRNNSNSCPRSTISSITQIIPDTPPPSYEHFAPPSYESICSKKEKSEFDVYVVPVHALSSLGTILEDPEDAPPSYMSASQCVTDILTSSENLVPTGSISSPSGGIDNTAVILSPRELSHCCVHSREDSCPSSSFVNVPR